ncbi:MAG: hypothetical protein ACI9DC_004886 [Gammaproteobacteria bacterium]|jgi:hypothetical protein
MQPLDKNERSLYQSVTSKWSGFTISYLDTKHLLPKDEISRATE